MWKIQAIPTSWVTNESRCPGWWQFPLYFRPFSAGKEEKFFTLYGKRYEKRVDCPALSIRYTLGLNPNLMGEGMKQRAFAIGIVLVVTCSYLQGCQVMVGGAVYGVEKVYLSKDRSPIYVTEDEYAVVGCVFKMDVKGERLLGGPFLEDQTLERVIADLTTEIYEGGANVLLIKGKTKGFWGSSVVGKGYSCTTIPAPPSMPLPKEPDR